jgi:hypothetical protein
MKAREWIRCVAALLLTPLLCFALGFGFRCAVGQDGRSYRQSSAAHERLLCAVHYFPNWGRPTCLVLNTRRYS